LKQSKYLINAAIENLDQGWAPQSEKTESLTKHLASTVTIFNQNVQINSLTVRQALEEVARQVGEKESVEGRRIGKWEQTDGLKALLETGRTAAFKYMSGG
jgi:hypothetical protein